MTTPAIAAHPWRLVGYSQATDADGNITLFAQRSPLDAVAEQIIAPPAMLKEIVGAYLVAEARTVLRPVESNGAAIPDALRLALVKP